jgi:alcohol dehydrogenase (cytochrome c)
MRALLALVLPPLLAAGCSTLQYLKPPSVPRAKGTSETLQGPAFQARVARLAVDTSVDWGAYNGTLAGTRYSPIAQISVRNASALRRVCVFDTGLRMPMQSGPVVVDGTLYLTDATHTWAIDAATCALRWMHTYEYRHGPPFDLKVNRGVAYMDGRLYRGANDGRVYALDSFSGEELWNVVVGDPRRGESFPAAPIAWHGLVFIGNAGGDNFGVTGRMMALDARTGGRVWSTELVATSDDATSTWPPATEVVPRAGGASWTTYALDTLAGVVYVPTGNAAPDFLPDLREGENLYTYSVVALDAKTGTLRGWVQLLRRDFHDWDIAASPALITTGSGASLMAVAGKDGHVYGVDRASGRIVYRTSVSTLENVEAPPTASGTRFCPGVDGGVEWNGPAYYPAGNLLLVNSIDWCTTVKVVPPSRLQGKGGLPWTGSSQLRHPFGVNDSTWGGWITALDADDGTVRWRRSASTPLVSGVTVTAGGVVFTADLHGTVLALEAATGRELWRYETRQPIGGGIVSYSVAGKQYVAVAGGLHAPATWRTQSSTARVYIFSLP